MRCPQCGLDKPPEDFPRHRGSKSGRHTYCKPCHNSRTKLYKLRKHGGEKNYLLTYRYGIDADRVRRLVAAQHGLCAICRAPEPKHVDHCHDSKRVRGLLCLNCNQGIGRFEDDVTTLRRAIDYLLAHDP
ncbi:MAG: endonuclease VII domain-containing protein [Actinomycetota bacterium]|nr:endonuclease VII domain-containing protein [Actinomycetota bacterium]